MNDCKDHSAKIIIRNDSTEHCIYTIDSCLTHGIEYCQYHDSLETVIYYEHGTKNGIAVFVDTIDGTIKLGYFKDNNLNGYFLYKVVDTVIFAEPKYNIY
jgi:hypothetical protein